MQISAVAKEIQNDGEEHTDATGDSHKDLNQAGQQNVRGVVGEKHGRGDKAYAQNTQPDGEPDSVTRGFRLLHVSRSPDRRTRFPIPTSTIYVCDDEIEWVHGEVLSVSFRRSRLWVSPELMKQISDLISWRRKTYAYQVAKSPEFAYITASSRLRTAPD